MRQGVYGQTEEEAQERQKIYIRQKDNGGIGPSFGLRSLCDRSRTVFSCTGQSINMIRTL